MTTPTRPGIRLGLACTAAVAVGTVAAVTLTIASAAPRAGTSVQGSRASVGSGASSGTASGTAAPAVHTRTSVVASAAAYASAHGYSVGIAVLDTVTGQLVGKNSTKTFATESVVKTMIATRLLLQGRMHGDTATRAYKMITQSDDTIASAFYGSVGGDSLITWIKNHYDIPNLGSEPRRPGWWGNTKITPAGLVTFYAKIKKDKAVGPWLINAMHHATTHGSDGVYQYFGIPSATTDAGIKQGWGEDYDYSHPTADYNSTGFVNGNRYAVALLAMGPSLTYGKAIGDLLTQVAKRVLPGGRFPDPLPVVTSLSTNHGSTAGGLRVTVHGHDFTHVTGAYFGGVKGRSVHVTSSTTLTVLTPRYAAKSVLVRVATSHGTATKGRYFGFGPTPTVRTLSVHRGPSSGGTPVTITGANFRGGRVTVYFGSTVATMLSRTSTTLHVRAPAQAARTREVRVRTIYGTSPVSPGGAFRYDPKAAAPSPPKPTGSAAPSAPETGAGTPVRPAVARDGAVSGATPARALADTLVDRLLEADPFSGSALGRREYDARVPDPSAAADDQLTADLAGIATLARSVTAADPSDAVTLDAVRSTCERRALAALNRPDEFTVSAMPIAGPPVLLATLARTALPDARAAQDYLERVRGSAGWLDATGERLREGAAVGRFPVGSLVDAALAWADRALAEPVPVAVTTPAPPQGWDGASTWRAELDELGREQVRPALARWRERIAELRPSARPDDRAGLAHLPGGEQDYARAIVAHTTLSFPADELHRTGLDEVARLSDRARELGARVGLPDLDAVRAAVRACAAQADPRASLETSVRAVHRAEAVAGQIMPAPLPAPCEVTPMPQTVAESGMAPHYTRPMPDGGRPGTYWFNLHRATAGTGWDLEAVTFHETVPGHHSQLARQQRIADLPLLQQMSVTAHSEGWGLYAERLAGEFGLYSDAHAQIGAVFIEMHRAARLVVDTGLHALGWSRSRAQEYLVGTVALAEGFLLDEIDRYIAWPGQALAYLVGQREILRARARAESALGDRFDLPSFHGALLDDGNLPMDVLNGVVDRWTDARR